MNIKDVKKGKKDWKAITRDPFISKEEKQKMYEHEISSEGEIEKFDKKYPIKETEEVIFRGRYGNMIVLRDKKTKKILGTWKER